MFNENYLEGFDVIAEYIKSAQEAMAAELEEDEAPTDEEMEEWARWYAEEMEWRH